jgi:Zn-dependent protease with chaperone function
MLLVTTLVAALASSAPGDDPAARRMDQFEAKVLEELAALAPQVLPDARAAAAAYRDGRWQEVIDAYRRVLDAAPRFAHALRRTCNARRELGDRAGALPFCRKALEASAAAENKVALARALVERVGGPRPAAADLAEGVRLARQALAEAPQDLSNVLGACSVALDAGDEQLVTGCADRLARLEPGSMFAEYFGIFGALIRGHHDEARRHLAAARNAGLGPKPADALARLIDDHEPMISRWGRPALWAAAAWATGLLLLLGAGALLSASTLRRARTMATDQRGEDGTGAALLRRVYAVVLWLTCAAYYLSLPLVLLAIVAAAVGLWMAFQAVGRIPIKLVLIVGLVVVVSAWAVLKSLWVSVVRPPQVDPGLPLDLAEHPRFDAALRQAAGRVGTRPVDRVFVTPGTDAAVFERGGLLQQVSGRTERCLILGVGILDGMTQGQLKAVLAHEYGHFVNRDTAGGRLALAVRRAVLQMAQSLARGGAATWYNPAWLFVNGFHRLFLRVSQGASRLQEILADRWAALAYGGAEFAAGLRHVITRDVRFELHARAALKEVIDGGLPLRNLYAYAPAQPIDDTEVTLAAGRIIDAEPSPYDSHPRSADRIAWVGGVVARHARDLDGASPAWSLFADREALERRLTDQVRANVAENHGVTIPAEPPPVTPGDASPEPPPA